MDIQYNKTEVSSVFFGTLIMLGLVLLAYLIKPVLVALSLTLVFVYLLHPIVEKIEPYIKIRWIAIVVTFFFVLVPFFIFTVVLTSTITSEMKDLLKTPQMKDLLDLLGENFKKYLELPSDEFLPAISTSSLATIRDALGQGFGWIVTLLKSLGGILLQLILGVFLTGYALLKQDSIYQLYDSISNRKLKSFILFVDEALKQVVYSMFLTALITGVIAIITYSLFGVPFAVLWGTTTGVIALIPLLGTWLVYTPIAIYFLIQGQPIFAIIFFAVSLVFVTILPDVAVRPIIASKKVDIGLILLGFVTGTLAYGAVGFIIGPLIIIAWVGFFKIFLLDEGK